MGAEESKNHSLAPILLPIDSGSIDSWRLESGIIDRKWGQKNKEWVREKFPTFHTQIPVKHELHIAAAAGAAFYRDAYRSTHDAGDLLDSLT
jgi:hypothetical protein